MIENKKFWCGFFTQHILTPEIIRAIPYEMEIGELAVLLATQLRISTPLDLRGPHFEELVSGLRDGELYEPLLTACRRVWRANRKL